MLLFSPKTIIGLMLIFCNSFTTYAQNLNESKPDTTISKKQLRKQKRAEKLAHGDMLFTPFAAPGYTPELGGLIAVGALVTFKTKKTDSLIQRSSAPVNISYTTKGAVVANAILSSFWFQDKIRIYGNFWYKNMPDNYWGIGYQKNYNNYESDSTTAYHRQWWWINPKVFYQFRKDFFIGLNIDYNYTKGTKASSVVAHDEAYKKYNDKPLNSGLGLMIRYDSRDIPVNAWSGMLLDFEVTMYSPVLGGDNKYQVFQFDYRQYEQIIRKGNTLAWQLKTRITTGDIPYGEMSQLGSPFDLRGYIWGRYRDESMFFFLAEYRHVFLKRNRELSKHGAVAWVGGGTIFNLPILKDNQNRWLPNFGLGYRLEIQPRMSLRLDVGIGRESTGFYFNFNQAF